jgi:hypothetical protein
MVFCDIVGFYLVWVGEGGVVSGFWEVTGFI